LSRAAVTYTALPATSADGRPTDQQSDWYSTHAHDLPASGEGVQRRPTAVAIALVLLVTRRTVLLLLPRFATLLFTTCGCTGGSQVSLATTPHALVLLVVSNTSQAQLRHRRLPLLLSPLLLMITYSPAKAATV
jgi:hypothetical protein